MLSAIVLPTLNLFLLSHRHFSSPAVKLTKNSVTLTGFCIETRHSIKKMSELFFPLNKRPFPVHLLLLLLLLSLSLFTRSFCYPKG